ncbi:hypothetical protein GCM10007108_09020 [Thermogymnomonas acidicola]|uniref:Uncharacterized protein n=1 Tax=Thermogymnomonas acidicola TaxID=399579 RepID=A0AA37BR84_9ARCH|nr:DUF929 family protein [Thermogymnomonas acidicola]GGM73234.1 hypothetical protein GCM10007108_09020 [Thermogymnomonas acidicola]
MNIKRMVLAIVVASIIAYAGFHYASLIHLKEGVGISDIKSPPDFGPFFPVTEHISASNRVTVLFIGAEACTFWDAESWVIYYALLHYGSWSSVQFVHSYNGDVFPGTLGINLMNATYSSTTIVFHGIEMYNETWHAITELNASTKALLNRYDPQDSIPFILINGEYLEVGSSYSPSYIPNMTTNEVNERPG